MSAKYLEHLGYHTPFQPGLDCQYCDAVKIMLTPKMEFDIVKEDEIEDVPLDDAIDELIR